MSLEFVNRICPNCKNPNYMVLLGDLSKAYKYKCMNCYRYFNDTDFEEPLQPVWKTKCVNTKVDMVEVIRCKNCKYCEAFDDEEAAEPLIWCNLHEFGRKPDYYCADAERKDGDENGKA